MCALYSVTGNDGGAITVEVLYLTKVSLTLACGLSDILELIFDIIIS